MCKLSVWPFSKDPHQHYELDKAHHIANEYLVLLQWNKPLCGHVSIRNQQTHSRLQSKSSWHQLRPLANQMGQSRTFSVVPGCVITVLLTSRRDCQPTPSILWLYLNVNNIFNNIVGDSQCEDTQTVQKVPSFKSTYNNIYLLLI